MLDTTLWFLFMSDDPGLSGRKFGAFGVLFGLRAICDMYV